MCTELLRTEEALRKAVVAKAGWLQVTAGRTQDCMNAVHSQLGADEKEGRGERR